MGRNFRASRLGLKEYARVRVSRGHARFVGNEVLPSPAMGGGEKQIVNKPIEKLKLKHLLGFVANLSIFPPCSLPPSRCSPPAATAREE